MTRRTHAGFRFARKQAHHWDTPPMDVTTVRAGLLACGSSRLSRLPGAFAPVAFERQQLAVHSCGGSAGLEFPSGSGRTGFPLSLRSHATRKTLTAPNWPAVPMLSMAAVRIHGEGREPMPGVAHSDLTGNAASLRDRSTVRFTKLRDEDPCFPSRPCLPCCKSLCGRLKNAAFMHHAAMMPTSVSPEPCRNPERRTGLVRRRG